jgi:hypothetical protein
MISLNKLNINIVLRLIIFIITQDKIDNVVCNIKV